MPLSNSGLKICSDCHQEKELAEFYIANTAADKHRGICKKCDNKRKTAYYQSKTGHEKVKLNRFKSRKKFQEWWQELKSHHKCELCPEDHPATLDFHHIDPTKKLINLALAYQSMYTKELILEEIKKCRVLCSNCHRKLHYDERMKKKQSIQDVLILS